MSSCQEWWEPHGLSASNYGFSFWGHENILESVLMVIKNCEILKTTELTHFIKIVNFMLCEFYLNKKQCETFIFIKNVKV